jgi:CubicO group peptidase (beta-lactamase class C family)
MEPVQAVITSSAQKFPIDGQCDERFSRVLDAFAANFSDGQEAGACVAVTLNGKPVVDLWGGYTDRARRKPWVRDTIVNMMSVSKAVAGMCVHRVIEDGRLDAEAPVAKVWPEFAAAGKEKLPLKYVLDHRAGLPFLEETLPRGAAYDPPKMAASLARMTPIAPPGSEMAYHVLSQGYLLGEIVRRATGQSLGKYFAEHFARPLGLDYYIGLPRSEFARCAEFQVPADSSLQQGLDNPESPAGRFWAQLAKGEDFNSDAWRSAEIPSANGHGNARAIARLFGTLACGGEVDGVRVMSRAAIDRMTTEQHNMVERFLKRHYHQASGVILNSPPVSWMGPSARAFGHHGAGGAIGFGDPDNKIGFSYAVNLFHSEPGIPTRARLVEAVFASL